MSPTESTTPPQSSSAIAITAIVISVVAIAASGLNFYCGKMQIKNINASIANASLQHADQLQTMQQQLTQLQKTQQVLMKKSLYDAPNPGIQKTFSDIANVAQSIQQLSIFPNQSPVSLQNTVNAIKSTNAQIPWYERILNSLKSLKTLFVIQHLDHPVMPLITPEQGVVMKQNILMQLNIAQWALLHHDKGIYQAALQTVSEWVSRYFSPSDQRKSILDKLTVLAMSDAVPTPVPANAPANVGI